ncbi:MAG: hypothetical protein NZ898_01955 [Myxococcota bacterium]|nr:hypothetical protein [Myxococcota bacterium]MDW8361574.1 tetratricopeptide repeat protein [Myxococcales bacterium]
MRRSVRAVIACGSRPAMCCGLVLLVVGCLLAPTSAGAQRGRRPRPQPPPDPLVAAETAYQQVDYESVVQHAAAALAAGGRSPAETARIYQLLGLSAAALDEPERAREAFLRMLALTPDVPVDRSLAPQLRSPWLEARGWWAARTDRLGVRVSWARARRAIRIDLVDPLAMAASVRIRWRGGPDGALNEERFEVGGALYVPVGDAGRSEPIEVIVEVLDEHGNRLFELGSEDAPEVVPGTGPMAGANAATEALGVGEQQPRSDDGRSHGTMFSSPVFWIGIGVAALGLSAALVWATSTSDPHVRSRVTIGVR